MGITTGITKDNKATLDVFMSESGSRENTALYIKRAGESANKLSLSSGVHYEFYTPFKCKPV